MGLLGREYICASVIFAADMASKGLKLAKKIKFIFWLKYSYVSGLNLNSIEMSSSVTGLSLNPIEMSHL